LCWLRWLARCCHGLSVQRRGSFSRSRPHRPNVSHVPQCDVFPALIQKANQRSRQDERSFPSTSPPATTRM
jgi:hypothetical protein